MAGVRIALAQINPTVGDLEGNRWLIERAIADAMAAGADLVALPELAVTGYPPEDLVLRPSFVADNLRTLENLAPVATGITAVVGLVDRGGDRILHAPPGIAGGRGQGVYPKAPPPHSRGFPQKRDFTPRADIPAAAGLIAPEMGSAEEVYAALVLGVRDYFTKNGFQGACLGLSGGIDSSLTAAVAADALGPGNVLGVLMPSEYTSQESLIGAQRLAGALGIPTVTLPIHDAYEVMLKILDPVFAGTEPGLAEENLQSRIRGNLLMAISNKTGRLVLSTGNKSEMSTGYATLYGDMAGGFAVLKDVPKTLVYDLSRWRNRDSEVIPQEVIDRPPTAELRANQLDSDFLPPYDILDPILQAYIEGDRSPEEIVADGFPADVVQRVVEMVDRAEYKRRQAPPGVKITRRAFGRDRRLPITNRYRPHF